jgi:ATP-dependent HslUV protease subunit HslV
LLENSQLDAESVVRKSLAIAADLCIYTNHQIVVETLG